MPEAEVGALDDGLGVQLVDEHLGDEVDRGQLRELGREGQDEHRVHAQAGHELGAAVVRGEQRRVAAGADDLAGVRVEGDDDGGHSQLPGAVHGMPDDQLVSAVDSVVGADGDDAAPPVLGDVLQATPALHCACSLSKARRTVSVVVRGCLVRRSKGAMPGASGPHRHGL